MADGGREGLRKILIYIKGGDDTICEEGGGGGGDAPHGSGRMAMKKTVCGVSQRDRNGVWWEVIRKERRRRGGTREMKG